MLFPVIPLIAHMSRIFTLNPGDIVMTGTPAGVGPLEAGDALILSLGLPQANGINVSTQVA